MRIAVIGATGLVGQKMLQILEERGFPVQELLPVASSRSVGQSLSFGTQKFKILDIEEAVRRKPDIALFSAGGEVSKEWAPRFAATGTRVIDNSSAWRMDPQVPLVVPEINAAALRPDAFIIANPNCSTIQMVLALYPLHKVYGLQRVIVSTYQSVTGTGQVAVQQYQEERNALQTANSSNPNTDPSTLRPKNSGSAPSLLELFKGLYFRKMRAALGHTGPANGKNNTSGATAPGHPGQANHASPAKNPAYPWPIDGNCIPQCDVFLDNDYTKEEMKMHLESQKILGLPQLTVSATAVRVPTVGGHSESVHAVFEREPDVAQVRSLLQEMAGVELQDEPGVHHYPMPLRAMDTDAVYVGRIRKDLANPKALNMWVVSDNLRKGAATNAVQIAEALISQKVLSQTAPGQ